MPPTSTRSYRPKDYAVMPRDFGRDRGLRWLAAPDTEQGLIHDARVIASRVQHGLVYLLRNTAPAAGGTDATHAALTGIDPDRFGRIRRGDLPIRTEEIGLICSAYKIPLWRALAAAGLGEPRPAVARPTQGTSTGPAGRGPVTRTP